MCCIVLLLLSILICCCYKHVLFMHIIITFIYLYIYQHVWGCLHLINNEDPAGPISDNVPMTILYMCTKFYIWSVNSAKLECIVT